MAQRLGVEAIGLDVGFSKTRSSSGVARLGPEGRVRVGHAMQSWESRSAIAGTRPVAVATIDAPYVRGDVSVKRGCERVLSLGPWFKVVAMLQQSWAVLKPRKVNTLASQCCRRRLHHF